MDTQTVTIGAKTYTFQASLTDSDGNIKIGATVDDTVNNLANAINLKGVAGTDYATSMTIHPSVRAIADTANDQVHIYAKTAGAGGESIATTETLSNASFYDSTLNRVDVDCNGGSPRIGFYMEDTCGSGVLAVNILFEETTEEKTYEYDYLLNYDCGVNVPYISTASIENGTWDVTITATDDLEQVTTITSQVTISC